MLDRKVKVDYSAVIMADWKEKYRKLKPHAIRYRSGDFVSIFSRFGILNYEGITALAFHEIVAQRLSPQEVGAFLGEIETARIIEETNPDPDLNKAEMTAITSLARAVLFGIKIGKGTKENI